MRYAPRQRLHHTLESIALTDIVLNLFIFFFITFSLVYMPKTKAAQAAVSVDLPRAGRAEARGGAVPILISLKAAEPDTVYVGEKAVKLGELAGEIRAMPPDRLAQGAVLRCDRTVSIERTLQVLDALQQTGLRDVSVATEPKQL
jgi:biopolymer transport protein ExbD